MAEKKFFVDINLQGSALTNAKIGTNTGIGSTEGAFGYDSGSHRLQYFNGTATKDVANLSDISAVTGGLIFQGGYDPTTDTPDITDGTALKGFFWAATAAGTFLGESVQVGDSIVAKVDNAGATIADWLILQGNVVIATDSVDGISRLATQTEANDGTEGGAVVITPATLQGKIDAQITPEISSKLPLAGGTMSGDLNLGGNNLDAVNKLSLNTIKPLGGNTDVSLEANLNAGETYFITNLPAPTNGGDAANKTYVDDQDALKLSLTGGTMSGSVDMGNNNINGVNAINTNVITTTSGLGYLSLPASNIAGVVDINENGVSTPIIYTNQISAANGGGAPITSISPINANGYSIYGLPTPSGAGDATNKTYVDDAASTAQANAEATASADATAKADAAQAAAEAYADSLAPNYDAAGAAATAEANANDYTDTAIENNSYRIEIEFADWTLNGSQYEFEVTHNITSTGYPVVTFTDENDMTVEAIYQALSGTAIKVIVNNRPPTLGVSLGAANPRI